MSYIYCTPRLNVLNREIYLALSVNWVKFVSDLGFSCRVASFSDDLDEILSTQCAGVILSGGGSIYSWSCDEMDKKRDEFEYNVIEASIRKCVPVIGVCRGMEIINDFFGGSLKPCASHAGTRHEIFFDYPKWSSFHLRNFSVNSYHDLSVDQLGDDLSGIAYSRDDVVEALIHSHYNLLGIMWHPERETHATELDLAFFKTVFS